MPQISEFVQVRADGKLVPSGMSVKEMLDLGWLPSKVVALRWTFGDRKVEIDAPRGVHGIVVPGANFIAMIWIEDEREPHGRLKILSAEGAIFGVIEDRVAVAEREWSGHFGWFEPTMAPQSDTFGAVFQSDEGESLRCDISARKLSVTRAMRIR